MVSVCKILTIGIILYFVLNILWNERKIGLKPKTGIGKYECQMMDSKISCQFSEELDLVKFFTGHYQRFKFDSEKEMYQKFYSYNITVPKYLEKYGSLDKIETILIYHYSQPYMIK